MLNRRIFRVSQLIISILIICTTSLFGQSHSSAPSYLAKSPNLSITYDYVSSSYEFGDEQKSTLQRENIPTRKSPGLAFVLSLFFPGGGQFYNGDVRKGVAMDAWIAGGFALILLDSNNNGSSRDDYLPSLSTFGAVMIISGSLWSLIDAPISASKKNKKMRNEFGHMAVFGSSNNPIGFDFGYDGKALGTKLTYHF